jgi:hypothetical protein
MAAIGSKARANTFAVQQDRTVFIAQPLGGESKTIRLSGKSRCPVAQRQVRTASLCAFRA